MRHHALEAGCFVICSTGWLDPEDYKNNVRNQSSQSISGRMSHSNYQSRRQVFAGPLDEGEGLAIAEINLSLITKGKE